MSDKISVRQWQESYRAGVFDTDAPDIQALAGWVDFDDPLNDRQMKSLSTLVLSITHPFILDNYHVFFTKGRPNVGRTYSSVCFYPLERKRFQCLFHVDLDYPYARKKWALSTRRYGEGEMEFECGHIRRMIRYIHVMAGELEQGSKPAFWPEMRAAQQYVFDYLPNCVYLVLRRESEHSYSTWERTTGRRVTLHVTHRPGDVPPGFQVQDAVPVCGLYVFPQKDDEKSPEIAAVSKKESRKKEAER